MNVFTENSYFNEAISSINLIKNTATAQMSAMIITPYQTTSINDLACERNLDGFVLANNLKATKTDKYNAITKGMNTLKKISAELMCESAPNKLNIPIM